MTEAKKLLLGFAILIALVLFTTLALSQWLTGLRSDWQEMAAGQEPANAAASKMELAVLSLAISVMQYLDSGEPAFKERIGKDSAEFESAKTLYDRLAVSPEKRHLGQRIGNTFGNFQLAGESLLVNHDQQKELFDAYSTSTLKIIGTFQEIGGAIDQKSLGGPGKIEQLLDLEAAFINSGLWLGPSAAPEFKKIFGRAKQFHDKLTDFEKLPLTASEEKLFKGLQEQLAVHDRLVRQGQELHQAARQQRRTLFETKEQLDDLLRKGVRSDILKELEAGASAAGQTIHQVVVTLWLMLIVGLVVGAVAALIGARMIFQTEQVLREERERSKITLASIGDGIIATDGENRVTFLNATAEQLTGWAGQAVGQPLSAVFQLREEATGKRVDPLTKVGEGATATPGVSILLMAREETTTPIEYTASPIRAKLGTVRGVVLTFRDVSQTRGAERRRNARLAITNILDRASTLEEAARAILHSLCQALSWDTGALWLVDAQAEVLRCLDVWQQPGQREGNFAGLTRQLTFPPGIGLPGRVWTGGEPTWIVDVHKDANFPRAPEAIKEGLHGAFGFPILVGQNVRGVVEFFSKEIRQPDADLLEMASTIGSQLGLFLVRKLAEQQLRQSEQDLSDSFESAAMAMHWVDRDGIILRANRAELNLLGYAQAEYVGQAVARFHADPAAAESMLQRLKAGETLHNHAARLVCKDGSIREVILDSNVYRRQGRFVHTCCFTRDITEQKLAEQAARESEGRFRTLADEAPVLIWMTNRSRQFDYFNQTWLDFTGREPDSGRDWSEDLHREDRAGFWETFNTAFAKRRKFELEFRLRRADGVFRWMLTQGVPRLSDGGAFAGFIGSCLDITERKQAEQDQRHALEAQAEADRRKNQFLAMLAHELRNPLAPIRNALHILRMGRLDDPDLDEARSIIERQVQQLVGIVDDLLDVFRITHHKITLHKEPLDLAELVRVTTEDHRSALESSQRRLLLDASAEPVWVFGDRTRLVQVLSNLLSNSAKFTNPGDDICVRVHADPERRRASVVVRDSGIGIAPEMLPRVFEVFSQQDNSLERNHTGLGLGLALVKGLVELHEGWVRAGSAGQGKGTEMSFSLPLSEPPPKPAVAPPIAVPVARPLRILIIEDNQDAARTLQFLLTRYGHEVRVAHTGPGGLAAARSWLPEVVLCDLGLPEMNGYEVAAALRADPATAAMRLIAVSGYGQEEDRQLSEQAGYDLHLNKPVDPVDLLRLLAVLKVGV